MAERRMSYADRHVQLLDTAAAIVRAEGADALTLARVAEGAGVSKPVAYEHFETRTNLLAMLYARIDDEQAEAARAALDSRATTLEEAVQVAAEAYVDCTLGTGKEFGTVTAALGSIAGAESVLLAGRRRYARILREAVERFTVMPADADVLVLGVIGATEALAREAASGRLERDTAVRGISRIMLNTLNG
ncbi:TetR/AcrR family transcriptional regulator [Actinacidiphila glaucinigra]|uniref:TetR/AcrR family transcriptional regulator n=1 Tax=Actinacidiphila glaucinigra TaxID=235986 RepID=UPI0035DBC145